jgi:uncharacterized protein YndB with AHSA1/START domain
MLLSYSVRHDSQEPPKGPHEIGRRTGIIEVDQSVVIRRPPKEVFAFLADLENWSQWQPDLRENAQTSRGQMDVGTTFRQALDAGGQRIELLGEVTEYEPDENLSLEYARDGLSVRLNFRLEPIDEGTRLIGEGEGRMSGFFSLFEPLVEREINERIKTGLADRKVLLKSRSPDT